MDNEQTPQDRADHARQQVSDLQAELTQLREQQNAVTQTALAETNEIADLQAAAVRTGTKSAIAAADAAESRIFELNMQAKRYQAAIDAAENELAAARADLVEAEQAAALDRIAEIQQAARNLFPGMDRFFSDWAQLSVLWREGYDLLRAQKIQTIAEPFDSPWDVWEKLHETRHAINDPRAAKTFKPPDLESLFFG